MNQRDIRDIAAYWGAPVKYEHSILGLKSGVVDWATMMTIQAGFVDELKLQLNRIENLAEEELEPIRVLCNLNKSKHHQSVSRNSRYISLYDRSELMQEEEFSIFYDGTMYLERDQYHIPTNVAPVIAYLQSIGVYVPGTISPNYVELIT
jgi:hypothetical protein